MINRPAPSSHVSVVDIGGGSTSYSHARPKMMEALPFERAGLDIRDTYFRKNQA